MGDRASCSITIGGDLPPAHLDQLLALIESNGLTVDWGGEPFDLGAHPVATPIELFADEINGGSVDDLEAFCVAQGLLFRRVSGGCPGAFNPEIVVFLAVDDGQQCFDADDNGRLVMTADTILEATSLAVLQARVTYAMRKIPPFIIMPVEWSTDAIASEGRNPSVL
jgi:hypothetical protein